MGDANNVFTQRVRFCLLAVALGSCGNPQAHQQSAERNFQDSINKMKTLALAPYVAWTAETPPLCTSPTLKKAQDSVLFFANRLNPRENGFSTVVEAGGWVLDVADGARDRGCKKEARSLYDSVISIYTGTAYSSLRQRAQIGIDDLRQMPDVKAASHTKISK